MKKNAIIISLIFIVPLLVYFALTRPDASYASKSVGANSSSGAKPQVLKFTSQMCLDCKKMSSIVAEVFPKYQDKITLVEVPVQSSDKSVQEKIKKYNVTLVPTMIYVSRDGKTFKKVEGAEDKKQFENRLKALING